MQIHAVPIISSPYTEPGLLDSELTRRSMLSRMAGLGAIAVVGVPTALTSGCSGTVPILPSGREVMPGMSLAFGTVGRMPVTATSLFEQVMDPADAQLMRGVVVTCNADTGLPIRLDMMSRYGTLSPGTNIEFRLPECQQIMLADAETSFGKPWSISDAMDAYGEDLVVVRDGAVISIWRIGLGAQLLPTDWLCVQPAGPTRA